MPSIVVARSENGVIGQGNELPWYLPADLKHFKELTLHHPVIMGRKTFDSIVDRLGTPLPERKNIVLSRGALSLPLGAVAVHTLEDALTEGGENSFVIGGAEIYRQAFPHVDHLHVTEVKAYIEGDTTFPEIDPQVWHEVSREEHEKDERNEHDFDFVIYERRRAEN